MFKCLLVVRWLGLVNCCIASGGNGFANARLRHAYSDGLLKSTGAHYCALRRHCC